MPDTQLQDIINRMVDAGESDEDIKLRVEAYKEQQAKTPPPGPQFDSTKKTSMSAAPPALSVVDAAKNIFGNP